MQTFLRYSRRSGSRRLIFEEEMATALAFGTAWTLPIVEKEVVDTQTTNVVGSAPEVKVSQTSTSAGTKPASQPVDYHVVTGLSKSKLPTIAERLAEISAKMAELKKEESELKDLGATLLIKAKVKSVMVGDIRVTQTGGQSKTIKRDLLLKYGVKEATIEKATVLGQPWTSLKVTVRKQGEEESGDDE